MRLTLNYNVYTVISACTHPCDTKTFTHNINNSFIATENEQYLNEVFLKAKSYPFRHKPNFSFKFILF